jgi:hypothetical protein
MFIKEYASSLRNSFVSEHVGYNQGYPTSGLLYRIRLSVATAIPLGSKGS